jgi:hypothetical protein
VKTGGWRGAAPRATLDAPIMPTPDPNESPPASDAASLPTPVRRVLASDRPPEAAVSRSFGAIGHTEAARHGAHIDCATTFAARRATVAELERPTPNAASTRGPLGGPMPARARCEPVAAVAVRVVDADDHDR